MPYILRNDALVNLLLVAVLLVLPCTSFAAKQVSPGAEFDSGVLQSVHGCELSYEFYHTASATPAATVIMAHGFMRDLKSQRGWAQQWADHNIATVVVSFCNASLLNGHHRGNADDLVALRKHLVISNPIYTGFSAGGLAAYLAAMRDGETIGYLGFDSVDSGDIALDTQTPLSVPALFLMAPPSSCNAKNNFFPVIERYSYPLEILDQATHCHFESPYDKRCAWICGKSETAAELVQEDIFDKSIEWILALI
jgi:pimeloyl-ACP methyl ester carboxylesterase